MPYEKLNQIIELLKKLEQKKDLCFIDNCENNSIGSHSISESRILDKLQEKDSKNKVVLFYLEDRPEVDFKTKKISTYKNAKRQLNREGKGNSSVFYGFCNEHDSNLFDKLDNEIYANNSKINFLHAYRAFALYITKSNDQFTFFKNDILPNLININPQLSNLKPKLKNLLQELNIIPDACTIKFEDINSLIKELEDYVQKDIVFDKSELRDSINHQLYDLTDKNLFPINGLDFKTKIKTIIETSSQIEFPEQLVSELEIIINHRINENDTIKSLFNSACLNKDYDVMNYFSRSFDGVYGITGNFIFNITSENIMSLTFFPEFEKDKMQVIISSIGNNQIFFSQLNIMNDIDYKTLLSSIIINQGTNVFMSPSFFNNLDIEIQTRMLNQKITYESGKLNLFN